MFAGMRPLLLVLALAATAAAPVPPPVPLVNHAVEFDRFAQAMENVPSEVRLAAFHARFDSLLPGFYASEDQAGMDRKITASLEDFPHIRTAYRRTGQRFPGEFDAAIINFRQFFPDFVSPYPVYYVHDLGQRDGGTMTVNGRPVMVFAADMIARIHDDDSLQPFLEHELFHLEHARHFECDQYWCQLWKEGLAVYAASVMTPGASDSQLLLDRPKPIRAETDAHMAQALCVIATNFDSGEDEPLRQTFTSAGKRDDLPGRFGYYVGYLLAQRAAQQQGFTAVTRMNRNQARPMVRALLQTMMQEAKADCAAPPEMAPAA